MSSVVTAVPPVISEWCIASSWFPTWDRTAEGRYHCGNASRGLPGEDYQSICCPGTITDLKFPIFKDVFNGPNRILNIDDLVCCPGAARLADATTCSSTGPGAEPTPLASYAATNADKAELYEATYPGASQGPGTSMGNMILTEVPYCIWMYTGNGTGMSTISLPAPVFTTTITPLGGWGADGTVSVASSLQPIVAPSSVKSASKTSQLTTSTSLRSSSSTPRSTTATTSSASRDRTLWNGWTAVVLAGIAIAAVLG